VNHARRGENSQEGLELAALLVRLSTFLGRPLGRAAAVGAMIGHRKDLENYSISGFKITNQSS
jgi:hypothetical protein